MKLFKRKGELQEFIFPGTNDKVRVLEHEGEAYFVAADIGKALGYTQAFRFLKLVPTKYQHSAHPFREAGLPNNSKLVHERGVYIGVGRCRTDSAAPFQEWVAEVVESARKTDKDELPSSQADSVVAVIMPVLEEINTRLKNIEENLELEVLSAGDFLERSGHQPTKEMVTSFVFTLYQWGVTAVKTLPGRDSIYERNLYSVMQMDKVLPHWRKRVGYRPTDITISD